MHGLSFFKITSSYKILLLEIQLDLRACKIITEGYALQIASWLPHSWPAPSPMIPIAAALQDETPVHDYHKLLL